MLCMHTHKRMLAQATSGVCVHCVSAPQSTARNVACMHACIAMASHSIALWHLVPYCETRWRGLYAHHAPLFVAAEGQAPEQLLSQAPLLTLLGWQRLLLLCSSKGHGNCTAFLQDGGPGARSALRAYVIRIRAERHRQGCRCPAIPMHVLTLPP